jgi:uridine kinase
VRVERLSALLARLHALPRRRLTLVVGVDGLTASGKTTFTTALAAADPALDVISVESFLEPDGRALPPRSPADLMAAGLDWRRLRSQVLLPLGRDQAARYEVHPPSSDGSPALRELPVGGIVLVEGLYACMAQLADLYDFRIWVECAAEVRARRLRRQRAGQAEGDSGGEGGEPQLDPPPGESTYISGHDPAARADLRVDGSGSVEHDLETEYVRLSRWGSGPRRRRAERRPPTEPPGGPL